MSTGKRPRSHAVAVAALAAACALLAAALVAAGAATSDDEAEETETMGWRQRLASVSGAALEGLDELVDDTWRRFERRMGFTEARHIAAYRGYANGERLWLRGRLLANKPYGGPGDDDGWWDNLKATYTRWESDEVPGAEIRLDYAGSVQTVTTDAEGYYAASFPIPDGEHPSDVVVATHALDDRLLTAEHRITHRHDDARFMIISDMDDTVIHTGITDLLLSAQLTFLNSAKTRKPLAGVGRLYRSLAAKGDDRQVNPVFYLSNSAWNMYDLLRDFLDLNDLPAGPLLLRDIGVGSDTSDHKIETLRRLLERFAPLPAILVGDSGQHDASIYAEVATEHPGRVRAIYIRDIDPDDDSEYDGNVDAIIARSRALGVPFLRVRDSLEIARHAVELGLMPASQVADVARGVAADRERETLAEETTGVAP